MALKKLVISFILCLLYSWTNIAQELIKLNPNDTITYSDENSKKVVEFGFAIDSFSTYNQPEAFISKLNKNVLFKRVLDLNPSYEIDIKERQAYLQGLEIGLSKFPKEIITEVQNDGYYDFVNYRYDQILQTYFVLFRFYSAGSGLNYHDFRLHKKNGELQFSDIYLYYSGENISKTFARVMKYTMPPKKILGFIEASKNDEIDDLLLAVRYKNKGDYEKAYSILNAMTSELSKEKFLLIFKSLIASEIDSEKYLNTLEELINLFPDDPTIVLNKVDYHIFKEEYFEAIQIVNQLQEDTEDDFLNYIKANIAFEDKNYDFALNNYKYIIDNYEDYFDAQAGYLGTLVMMKQFSEATTFIDTLITEGYEKEVLIDYIEKDDEYGENILEPLVNSKAYKTWKLKTN